MNEFFLKIFNMSISASWIILVVLILRLLLKKAPKWINVLLWGIVAVRLICPFSIESVMSLMPSTETINPQSLIETPEINAGVPTINNTLNPIIQESTIVVSQAEGINVLQLLISIFSKVWIVGVALMLTYSVISYIRIKIKIGTAVMLRDNIYQSEAVVSPFVLGLIMPKIYLPFDICEQDIEPVIAHEQAHIHRKDYLWKPIGFLLLTLHWFNPLVWLAYILLCRDIELACDEKAIKEMTKEQRADYSQALLACSINRRMIAACPLAFGEVNVKNRIKNVLNYKKPAFWIILVAVISSIAVAACFLTNPVNTSKLVLDKLFNSDEYDVVEQNTKHISLSLPISKLPDSIYTKEGATFKANEIIAYKDETTTIYLKEVALTYELIGEGDPLLSFCFDFSFDLPKEQGTLLHPLRILDDSRVQSSPLVVDGILKADNKEFVNAVAEQGQGPNCLIFFYVSADALRQCEDAASFDILLNQITYCLHADDYTPATYNSSTDTNSDEFTSDENATYDINKLKAKYPMYFNLDTTKGLTVYIWQMAEDSYSCGLLPNTNTRHTEHELLRLQASPVTLDEMRSIVTYYYPSMTKKHVAVCPITMPTSSYFYIIDEEYTYNVNDLFWCQFSPIQTLDDESFYDTAIFDIDGDGIDEECALGHGPTSGIYSFIFSVFENGELEYFNIFAPLELQALRFDLNEEGQVILRATLYKPDGEHTHYMSMAILDGNITIFSDEEDIFYWGEQGINSPFAPK